MAVGHLPAIDDNSGQGDIQLSKLEVVTAAAGPGRKYNILPMTTDGTVETHIDSSPQLTLQLLDDDLSILNSNMFTQRMDCTIDGVPFRLTRVSLDLNQLTLGFEHRVVAWLRNYNTPKHWSRGKFTRAEVIQAMIDEMGHPHPGVKLVAPQLHDRQPIKSVKSRPTEASRRAAKAAGFPDNVRFKIAGGAATKAQISQVERALDVAVTNNAPVKAMLAMLCAGIQESAFRPVINRYGYGGVFQGQVLTGGHYFRADDTEGEAYYFLHGGKGYQGGGAIHLARTTSLSPGQIARRVEAPQASATESLYTRWEGEAKNILSKYQSDGSFPTGGKYYGKYEFTRGVTTGGSLEREDSWTCMQRLAQEVRWALFVHGASTIYYATETRLIQQRPMYKINPNTEALTARPSFDIEVGHRTVVTGGHRTPKLSTCSITVRASRWAAPAGSVILLENFGVADGHWLVESTSRSLFDAEMTVQLRRPQKPLPEPAAQIVSRPSGASVGKKGKVVIGPGSNIRPDGKVVNLSKPLLEFLHLVAGQAGETITVTTGSNHPQYSTSGLQSDHWTGQAADIGLGGDARYSAEVGRKGDRIAAAALVVLGYSAGKAARLAHSDNAAETNFSAEDQHDWADSNGNHHRVQIGWRTLTGGNHYTHVHIGVK